MRAQLSMLRRHLAASTALPEPLASAGPADAAEVGTDAVTAVTCGDAAGDAAIDTAGDTVSDAAPGDDTVPGDGVDDVFDALDGAPGDGVDDVFDALNCNSSASDELGGREMPDVDARGETESTPVESGAADGMDAALDALVESPEAESPAV